MKALAVAAVAASLLVRPAHAAPADEAKKIFNQRCTACHTFGKGLKVGPDLKGVTERRQRAWLMDFIRSSQKMIASGDPIAVELFQKFKQERMPDWTDLSDKQIEAILDWLAANGPEQKPADERIAELATFSEIELGRDLFHGRVRFARGGTACGSCHAVSESGARLGGSFGPDLTAAYTDYRDRALTLFLKKPCTPRMPESSLAAFLAPNEAFALKAFLRKVALPDQSVAATSEARAAVLSVAWVPPSSSGASSAKRVLRGTAVANEILFLVFPYAAVLLLAIGLVLRHALARRQGEALRAGARQAWRLFGGGTAWRVSLAVLAGLHVLMLLVPGTVTAWNGTSLRLYLLEGTGFVFGLVALGGWGKIMWRHFGRTAESRGDKATEILDCIFLSLFFVAIGSGLLMAVLHRWGSSWAGGTLTPYLVMLIAGDPVATLVAQMPFLVKLHVFSLFALIAVLPFSSAILIPVAAFERMMSATGRSASAGARMARTALARLSPARWLWPEEDLVDDEGNEIADDGPAAEPENALVYPADSENRRPST